MTAPKYIVISDYVRNKVKNKEWIEGYKIPSETLLADQFNASRMTARKAVDLLVDEELLLRSPSVGTFVNKPKIQSSLLEIKNIKEEILARNHTHKMLVLSKMKVVPNDNSEFELRSVGDVLFKIVILHLENNTPIQLEERYVNSTLLPDFLNQDFTKVTPNEYLTEKAPLTDAKISVEAIHPSEILRHHLKLGEFTPCLKVTRLTSSNHLPISLGILYHPADKYKLTSVLSR